MPSNFADPEMNTEYYLLKSPSTSAASSGKSFVAEVRQHFLNCKTLGNSEDGLTLEDKGDSSELVEYRDKSWCICVRVDLYKKDNDYEMVVYSYQNGVEKFIVRQSQITQDLKSADMIKYRKSNGEYEVQPIFYSLNNSVWISVKVRINKGIHINCYAISGFYDNRVLQGANEYYVVWSDAVGAVSLSFDDIRQIPNASRVTFNPLSLIHITLKADFKFEHGLRPKWSITSVQQTQECDDNAGTLKIGSNLWPARLLRFDDLLFKKTETFCKVFQSYSNENVVVKACRNLFALIESAGPKYAQRGIMTAVVYPSFQFGQFSHYEALILGPLKVVLMLTEERLLNFIPKTFPPNLDKKMRHQTVKDEKKYGKSLRDKHSWDYPYNCRSLGGSFEI